jgi:Flp pilus assembly protein TadD
MRLLGAVTLVALFGVAGTRNALQLAAMQLYSENSKVSVLERASAMDPGNFRMHVRLGEWYVNRGSCTKARPHAIAARALFPSSPAARRLSAACGR